MNPPAWTMEEDEKALALKARGLANEAIGAEIGRTGAAVKWRLFFLSRTPDQMLVMRRRYIRKAPPRSKHLTLVPIRPEVPDHVWEDRNRRLAVAPASLTAAMFGDPIPERSALWQRSAQ